MILRFFTLSSLCCSIIIPLFAQDANYWTNQYGTRSTLLGGAVVGSVLDLSGTYYNPGGLGLIDKPSTLEAAKVLNTNNPVSNLFSDSPFRRLKWTDMSN